MKANFSKTLTSYLSVYLPQQLNLSANTIASYCDTFKLLLRYCRDHHNLSIEKIMISDITIDIIQQF